MCNAAQYSCRKKLWKVTSSNKRMEGCVWEYEGCCSRLVPTMMCTVAMVWRLDTRDIITPARSTMPWTRPRPTPSWGSVLSGSRAASTSQELFKRPVRWQVTRGWQDWLTVILFRVDIPWLCRGDVPAWLRLWHRPSGRRCHRPARGREASRRGGQHLLLQQPEL